MATNRPKSSQQTSAVAAARYALNTSSQRGRASQSKRAPSSTGSPQDSGSAASPDIKIDEVSPIQARLPRQRQTSSELSTEHHENVSESRAQRERRPRSRSRSNSASSSSSSSSSSISSGSDSAGPELESLPRRSSPAFSSSFSTNRSTTSLLSQRNKSYSSLSRSLYSANPALFAPPFYNRPPTPLPPSPSLTSLLRPTFSATPSRPTTPDDSDTESHAHSHYSNQHQPSPQHNHIDPHSPSPDILPSRTPSLANLSTTTTGTSAHTPSAYTAPTPLPRTIPKVPTYEYYGFVLYLTSSLSFLGYLLWSYLPSPFLHRLGIYYYPDRWWSLAVPAWIVVAVLFVYVLLASYNAEIMTLKLGNLGAVVDDVGVVAVIDRRTGMLVAGRGRGRNSRLGRGNADVDGQARGSGDREWNWKECWNHGTDAVLDIPIGGVCEVLYGGDTR